MKRLAAILVSALGSQWAFGAVSALRFQGQRLSASDAAIYKEFQLKAGDVIISFNDKPLTSPKDAMELYNKLNTSGLAKLLIERDGHYELLTRSTK